MVKELQRVSSAKIRVPELDAKRFRSSPLNSALTFPLCKYA
jgi:hypothetical protein